MNNLETRKLSTLLQRLGLISSEVSIFLLGMQHGALSIAQLADISNIGRITVHEIVGRLIQKGLYLESRSGRKRLVYPNQVDALEKMIDSEKFRVQQLEKDAQKAMILLRNIQNQSEGFPNMRYYKGHEGIQHIISEIKHDKNNVSIMSDGQHFYELIDNDFLEKSIDIRKKHKIGVQLLFPSGFEYFTYTQGTHQQELHIKTLPDQNKLKGGITIRGAKVAFHAYEGSFITTTIVENQKIADMQQYLFDQTRKSAKDY